MEICKYPSDKHDTICPRYVQKEAVDKVDKIKVEKKKKEKKIKKKTEKIKKKTEKKEMKKESSSVLTLEEYTQMVQASNGVIDIDIIDAIDVVDGFVIQCC